MPSIRRWKRISSKAHVPYNDPESSSHVFHLCIQLLVPTVCEPDSLRNYISYLFCSPLVVYSRSWHSQIYSPTPSHNMFWKSVEISCPLWSPTWLQISLLLWVYSFLHSCTFISLQSQEGWREATMVKF